MIDQPPFTAIDEVGNLPGLHMEAMGSKRYLEIETFRQVVWRLEIDE